MLISMCLTFLMYVEPPITKALVDNSDKVDYNKYYNYLCVGCNNKYIRIPIYAIQILFAIIAIIVVAWILCASFRKFTSDGAKLAEEEDGSN